MPPTRDMEPTLTGERTRAPAPDLPRRANVAAGDVIDVAGAGTGWLKLPAVDLGWRNVGFSLRTAAAAILALAIAYQLDIGDPQWATLTVYLLAQPTVGAAISKGTWRAVGTVLGGVLGLAIVAAFSQARELLVAVTVLVVGASFYLGSRLRNFTAYGVLLGGYTALLVAYEGSLDPAHAWIVAADRIGAILVGIACITVAGIAVLPRYAGDALREGLRRTFRGLSAYVSTALRLSERPVVFARMRAQMVREVVAFDALRSYAVFEAPDMRANSRHLERIVTELLVVLSVARGLFVRLDAFSESGGEAVEARLRPTLQEIARRVEQAAADPAIWRDTARFRAELREAHRALRQAAADLEGMAGSVPFDPLANGLLVVNRVGGLLDRLAMVVVAESASLRAGAAPRRPRRPARAGPDGRQEALLLAVRAASSIALLSILWIATGWDEGFTAISGGIITLLLAVNQDNQQAAARTYLIWTAAGIAVAYLVLVFVMPYLEGFAALAAVLMIVLFIPGLMAGTPSHALAGAAFGAFAISELSIGNQVTPDESAFVNGAVALLLGMVVCLAVVAVMPVNSRARRDRSWRLAIGTILPAVIRGSAKPRRGSDEIVGMLAALLPRLSLEQQRDEDFLRGTLGAASAAVELGRLVELAADPDVSGEVGRVVAGFLARFAPALEALAAARRDRPARVADAEAIVAEARERLSGLQLVPGPAARHALQAGASLRFLADRFYIDRAYLERGFDDD